MDLSKYSKCPSYKALEDAEKAFKLAFARRAQVMPLMRRKRDDLAKLCDRELAALPKPKPPPVPPKPAPVESPPKLPEPPEEPDDEPAKELEVEWETPEPKQPSE